MNSRLSPTTRLMAGLAITLTAVAVYAGYTIFQLGSLQELQTRTIDRNRADSLLLLRIQNNLNSLAWPCATCWTAASLSAHGVARPIPPPSHRPGRRASRARSGRRRSTAIPTRAIPARLGGPVLGRARPHLRAGATAGRRRRRGRRSGFRCRPGSRRSARPWRGCWCRTTKPSSRRRQHTQAIYARRGTQRLCLFGRHAGADLADEPVPGAVQPAHVSATGGGALGAPQRAGAATDLNAGEHLPLDLARAARRFRPDPHRHRRDAAAGRQAARRRRRLRRRTCARSRRSCSPRSRRCARSRTRCIRRPWKKWGSRARSTSTCPASSGRPASRSRMRSRAPAVRWTAASPSTCTA